MKLYCLDCGHCWPLNLPKLQSELSECVKQHGKCHKCRSARVVDYRSFIYLAEDIGLEAFMSLIPASPCWRRA